MYVIDGIAYAGTPAEQLEVISVVPFGEYKLLLRFNNGEQRIFDFTPLLDHPAFMPLKDKAVFESVKVDYGCPVWLEGEIDIAPETVYHQGFKLQTRNAHKPPLLTRQ